MRPPTWLATSRSTHPRPRTHPWHVFEEAGLEQTLASPAGGAVCHGYCGLLNTRLTDGRQHADS